MFRVFWSSFFMVSLMCCGVFSEEALPEPYNSLQKLLPYNDQGWFANSSQLKSLIKTRQVKTVIEVGCWMGASTRFIASHLPSDGRVYAVDHWLGSEEHQPGQSAHSPSLPVLYEQFLSNVIHAKLTHKIIPVQMPSLEAADSLRSVVAADLIYIDADHSTASVYADLIAWYPFVQENGVICGDDWDWRSVRIAVRTFAKEQGLSIEVKDKFWCLVKTAVGQKQKNRRFH